jgi:phospholipase C
VAATSAQAKAEIEVSCDPSDAVISVKVRNHGSGPAKLTVTANAYRADGPWTLTAPAGGTAEHSWSISNSNNWYDFTVAGVADFERRFAGRLESGNHGISDPAMGTA